jgi:hypothetical protein
MREANPDFLVIGPARSATGWLFKRLSRHPQIYIPQTKEIHFFDRRAEDGASFVFDLNNPVHWRWYWTFFRGAAGRRKGDMTPAYSILPPERIAEIAKYLPDVKVIYTIRDPIDRAWSGLCFGLWYGRGITADQLSESELMHRLMQPQRLDKGDHKTNIENWKRYYPSDRFKCIFFEDVRERPHELLTEICGFLQIDADKLPGDEGDRKVVNSVPKVPIPEHVRIELARYYESQLPYVRDKFGRKLDNWLV